LYGVQGAAHLQHDKSDEVTVVCEKQGYEQLRVYRRGLPPPGSKNPVETECTLQRI
jgi:hypothetical protein